MSDTPSPAPEASPVTVAKEAPLLLAGALTVLGDFLLWPARPGLSLGLFAVAAGAAVTVKRPGLLRETRSQAMLVLLAGSAWQSAIEISFSNVLVLFVLLNALLAESLFPKLRGLFQRAVEVAFVYARAPLRWLGIVRLLGRVPWRLPSVDSVQVILRVVVPTALLVGVFAILLGTGNAIFSHELGQALDELFTFITSFSPLRALFWLVLGTFALALTAPFSPVLYDGVWASRAKERQEPREPHFARWRSWSILGALNVLFFAANTTDAAFLWVRRELPEGVNYSAYVHQGVWSLVSAVLLSAVVLVALWQQHSSITASRLLRGLAFAWIAQNIFLTASSVLRLKLYVDTYQLSTLRIYVAFFLGLVTVGFVLLAWRIGREKSFGWLVHANALATFFLFAIVQTLPVEGWVADFNVAQWERTPGHQLDVEYLSTLGPGAYPALVRAAETPNRSAAHAAFEAVAGAQAQEEVRLQTLNWRSREWRRDRLAAELVNHQVATRAR